MPGKADGGRIRRLGKSDRFLAGVVSSGGKYVQQECACVNQELNEILDM